MNTTNPALADLTDTQLLTHLKGLRDRQATSTQPDAVSHFARLIDEVFIELGRRVAAEHLAKEQAREQRLAQQAAKLAAIKRAKHRDDHRKGRETVKRIIAELGTTFEISGDGYIEVAPWEGYPQGFTTLHYDWTETHSRFELALGDPTVLDEAGYYTE